jgi:hypothetical protein
VYVRRRRPRQVTDGRRERVGLRSRHAVRERVEDITLLAPDVRLQQVGERGEGRTERGVAVGRGDRLAQRREATVLLDQLVEQRGAPGLVRQVPAQEREPLVLLRARKWPSRCCS